MTTITLQYSRRAHRWCDPRRWFSAIAWYDASRVTHGEIVLPAGVDQRYPRGGLLGSRMTRMGAPKAGVQVRPIGYTRLAFVVFVQVPVRDRTDADPSGYPYTWAIDQIGRPYDWLAVFAFFFNRNWRREGAWYCTEFTARWREVIFAQSPMCMYPNKVTPGTDLAVASALQGSSWMVAR